MTTAASAPTKQRKLDAAVAVVKSEADRALQATSGLYSGYLEAYSVASRLEEQGVLSRADWPGVSGQDRAEKRLEGQTKRLLDEEAAKPDARIMRLGPNDYPAIPYLDGQAKPAYARGVKYTTPEFYAKAAAAVEAAKAARKAIAEEMADLIREAEAVGLPKPLNVTSRAVTYDVAGLRALVLLAKLVIAGDKT